MYSLDFSTRAKRFLIKLDGYIISIIIDRLENLKENPVPSGARFIGRDKGDKVFRYRIWDYRALYKLKD